jgi:hypothetical protein
MCTICDYHTTAFCPTLSDNTQGCQMVYFQTKNPYLGKFWNVFLWNVMAISYISWFFDLFFTFWYNVGSKKIWQPWQHVTEVQSFIMLNDASREAFLVFPLEKKVCMLTYESYYIYIKRLHQKPAVRLVPTKKYKCMYVFVDHISHIPNQHSKILKRYI